MKRTLTIALAAVAAMLCTQGALAQDWWDFTPFPSCSDGQIYVWSGGGMTCGSQQSLAAYALLAGADFSGEVLISTELNIEAGAALTANGTQAAAVDLVVITYTANDPSIVPDAAVTIADGATPTVNELLELVVELQAQVEALQTALEGVGIVDTAP